MEILIAIILLAITLIFFILRTNSKEADAPIAKNNSKKKEKITDETPIAPKEKIETPIASDNKEILLNSFRELKEMKNLRFIDDGKTFLFSDEKRIIIAKVENFVNKNIKFISKSIEIDTISDLVYSKIKK
jgi:hypothetical protein